MKLKVNWKSLGKALWVAVKPVLLGAIGIPGIAVVTKSELLADNKGDDENKPVQANPVTVDTKVKLREINSPRTGSMAGGFVIMTNAQSAAKRRQV